MAQADRLSDIQRAAIQILGLRAVEKALMGITEVRDRMRSVPGADKLSMHYGANGSQIFELNGNSVTLPPSASDDQIVQALTVNINIHTEHPMSITGAPQLRARFEAAKARKAAIEAKADAAVKRYNDAGDIAESAIKQLEADADALLAEVKDSSNGGPA